MSNRARKSSGSNSSPEKGQHEGLGRFITTKVIAVLGILLVFIGVLITSGVLVLPPIVPFPTATPSPTFTSTPNPSPTPTIGLATATIVISNEQLLTQMAGAYAEIVDISFVGVTGTNLHLRTYFRIHNLQTFYGTVEYCFFYRGRDPVENIDHPDFKASLPATSTTLTKPYEESNIGIPFSQLNLPSGNNKITVVPRIFYGPTGSYIEVGVTPLSFDVDIP